MLNKKDITRMAIATVIVLAILSSLATAAYAADGSANINISVDGDIPAYISQFTTIIREPLQVALNYLTSFLSYLTSWLGQF